LLLAITAETLSLYFDTLQLAAGSFINIMARQLRLEFHGAIYHITSRGNAKQEIFLDKEFGISTTRVSKIQGEIERIDKMDPNLLNLIRKYKVKQ